MATSRRRVVGICALCSFAIVFFSVVTPVLADEIKAERTANRFKFIIFKLDLNAAACKGYAPFDAVAIRQKLRQYSIDQNGFDYFEPLGEKVDEIRARLARAPAAESQRQCVDALRQSSQEYMVMRDLYMHKFRDERAVPPLIDLGSIGTQ